MGKCIWLLPLGLLAAGPGAALAQSAADLTNLREDVNGLSQRVSELTLRVEQLENAASQSRGVKPAPDAVTSAQLQAAVADLTAQLERLRANVPPVGPAPAAESPAISNAGSVHRGAGEGGETAGRSKTFSDDFPKQGRVYEVQKGDTVALIAKKTGAKFQDIVNANKLADPSKIMIGQKLFVPAGK